MRVRKKWPGTKIVSMLNDADFYSNFIPTHQQGTQQLFSFSQRSELTAVPKHGGWLIPPLLWRGDGCEGRDMRRAERVPVSWWLSSGSPRATEQEWIELEEPLHSSGAEQPQAHPCCGFVPCTNRVSLCLKQVLFRKPLL